ILHLHVGGQVIKTTAEHPFWVDARGWVDARDLRQGDLLCGHDGRFLPVEDVYDTGEDEAVYNMRIADYHTYFVGCLEWGFSVWAHNTCDHVVEYLKSIGITNQATIDEVIQAARLSDPAGIRLAINRATGRRLSLDELIAHSNM